jgi:hypothetical protein
MNFWFISRFSLTLINKSKTAYIMHGSLRYKEIICVQNYFSGSYPSTRLREATENE